MRKRTVDTRRIALAAAAGLSLAAVSCKKSSSEAAPPASGQAVAKANKACCKGLNECKGKGGCAVPGKNDCAGKNECKAKGGCNMHCPN
jgi:hypothetical protein